MLEFTEAEKVALRKEIEGRKHEHRTFGQLYKTKREVERLIALAMSQGWDELAIETVELDATVTRYKLTGIPDMYQKLQEMNGTKLGLVNAPRVTSAKRRKGQAYRYRGK